MVTKTSVFVAADGTRFDTFDEAVEHEMVEEIAEVLSENQMHYDFNASAAVRDLLKVYHVVPRNTEANAYGWQTTEGPEATWPPEGTPVFAAFTNAALVTCGTVLVCNAGVWRDLYNDEEFDFPVYYWKAMQLPQVYVPIREATPPPAPTQAAMPPLPKPTDFDEFDDDIPF